MTAAVSDLHLSADTGLSVSIQLYQQGIAFGPAIAAQEIAATGEYQANMPTGTAAGRYLVIFYAGQNKLASGVIDWDGTQEVKPPTAEAIKTTLEKKGSKLDRALRAAQSAEDQTA